MDKTNAIRALDKEKIPYVLYNYPSNGVAKDAQEVASLIQKPEHQVYKTLVAQGASKSIYVFVIAGSSTLDLKKAASSVMEKSIELIEVKRLLPLTGYVRGGCSPLGMKRLYPTIVDNQIQELSTVIVSAGKIGLQIEVSVSDLLRLSKANVANICTVI